MSKTMLGLAWVLSMAMPMSGCTIETCEEGADCTDGGGAGPWDPPSNHDETELCLGYCNRLNVCGAPQAADFDACVAACEKRFEKLPDETEKLCTCMVDSLCEDAVQGRCTPKTPGDGTGGSHSAGGGSSTGGTQSTGGTHSTGGSSSPGSGGTSSATGGSSNGSGGSSGTATGGSPPTGGSTSTGGSMSSEGGAACGGETSGDAGESSSAGTGPAGAGGDGIACTCDCQCAAEEACVDGYCSSSG